MKEPRSPVGKERAMQHALLTIRRAWAGEMQVAATEAGRTLDFEGWGGFELDPEPLDILDLNGEVLFHEFGIMNGAGMVGSVKASASKFLGSAVPAIELGPRKWDPGEAIEGAKKKAKEKFPAAKISGTELVCYSYPKIGVRIDIEDPGIETQSILFDVSDLSMVERFGADEEEGYTSWSFYEETAGDREPLWEMADRELEAARSATPRVFETAFTDSEMDRAATEVLPAPVYPVPIPFYSSKVITYAPRCSPHECFALYAQKTNVYCAVATGQMILDFYRYYYTQARIAAAMGTGANGTSNPGQVNGYETLTRNCMNATYDSTANWTEAKAEIDANRPLKSGIPGHARACAGWKRSNISIIGQPPKRWLKIYDPWPWNANICNGGAIVWEDWDAVNHTNFIYLRRRTTTH
jgi:hypothetical protein